MYILKYIEKYKKLKKKYCSESLNSEDCLGLYNFAGKEITNRCTDSKSSSCHEIKSIFCSVFKTIKECNSQVNKTLIIRKFLIACLLKFSHYRAEIPKIQSIKIKNIRLVHFQNHLDLMIQLEYFFIRI